MEKEKTYNGYEVLEKLSGIPKTEQMKIMENIRENRRKLESCNLHDFSIEVPKPYRKICPDYKCSKCGGIVEWSEKSWYEKGFEHAIQMGGTVRNDENR